MSEYLEILDRLFTPQQQTALVIITLGVMILTQAFKNIYFGFHTVTSAKKKKAIIWSFALAAGIGGGYVGYIAGVPKQPLWFWIFSGVSAGGFALGTYKLIIEIIWPRLSKQVGNKNG